MQDKVKLTKEQASVLEYVIESYGSDKNKFELIVRNHSRESGNENMSVLRKMPLDTLIRALYIGYEVMQTIEEKMVAAYSSYLDHNMEPQDYGNKEHIYFQQGMRTALLILEKKIPGITD